MGGMALPRPHARIRLRAKTTRTRAPIICASNSRRTPTRIREVEALLDPRCNDEIQMTNAEGRSKRFRSRWANFVIHYSTFVLRLVPLAMAPEAGHNEREMAGFLFGFP